LEDRASTIDDDADVPIDGEHRQRRPPDGSIGFVGLGRMGMSAKKILFLVDFAEDYEVMVPFQALTMVGHIVHAVCPGKKAVQQIKTAIHDFEGDQTYSEKLGHNFTLNASFAEVVAEDYDALMIARGRAPEYLRLDRRLIEIVRAFTEADKPIAAICHAARIPAAADVTRGRRVSGYWACAPEVRLAGAEFVDTAPDRAIRDGNLVSGFAWSAHPQFLALFFGSAGHPHLAVAEENR
jgi:deglycase